MTTDAASPAGGWPFWAPSADDAVERALGLAGLAAGERFVDLGCGDGRVLVAAARRGAVVAGVECDEDLAGQARDRLAGAGVPGTVVQADIFTQPLDADVVFTYLSPATLQRLRPVFDRLAPGARLVTVDFAVPDAVPDRVDGGAHRYVVPLRSPPPGRPGWDAAGGLAVALPDVESLTCLELTHPGGPVTVAVDGDLADVATFATGTSCARAGQAVAVDVVWGACGPGTAAAGVLRVSGVGTFPLFVLFSAEDGGLWDLNAEACRRLTCAWEAGTMPASVAGVLAVAEGEDR